jgi:site-specific recombinase XerD
MEKSLEPETLVSPGTSEVVPVMIEVDAGSTDGLENNPAAVYLASLRPSGRRTMLQKLNEIAEIVSPPISASASNEVERNNRAGAGTGKHTAFTLPWHQLRYQHTAAIRAVLQERYKPATANTALSALRQVLKTAWRLGQMSAEEYQRAADQPVVKGQSLLRGRALAGGELAALINACYQDDSPIGFRDAALVAVLYAGGLRRSEIAKLDLENFDEETGALTILGGKGGKDRICYMGTGSDALSDWLKIRGKAPGPLFYPIRRGGHIEKHRMTEQSVLYILQKRGKEAGVKAFSPHDIRRTFISDLLDAGADIATVQKLAGHAGVQTTARYDRRGEVTKKQAAGKLHLPYNRKSHPDTKTL